MTTAAKRARKKANKLKGWPEKSEEEMSGPFNDADELFAHLDKVAEEPVTTESEHAAAMTALAQVKRMRKKAGE